MKTIITIISSAAVFMWVVSRPYAEPPTVTASWYGMESAGITANGERFDGSGLTAAMWEWEGKPIPFNSLVKVTLGPKNVIVRINDRGPNKRLGRAIDLSREAFAQICDPAAGLCKPKLELIRFGK